MKKFRTHLILHDVHVPWHSRTLLKKICKLATDNQFDSLILGGDFCDLYSLSRHNKGSLGKLRELTLEKEYEIARSVMGDLLSAVGRKCDSRKFLRGNHESNHERWLAEEDHSKVGGCLESPEEALRLVEQGFECKMNWMDDYFQVGEHLQIIHGTKCGIHCSKTNLDAFEQSTISGHTHRAQSHFSGKRCSISNGYLGDPDSLGFKYMPRESRARWMQGFCVVNEFPDGGFHPIPVSCYGERFVFNGRSY